MEDADEGVLFVPARRTTTSRRGPPCGPEKRPRERVQPATIFRRVAGMTRTASTSASCFCCSLSPLASFDDRLVVCFAFSTTDTRSKNSVYERSEKIFDAYRGTTRKQTKRRHWKLKKTELKVSTTEQRE